MTRPRPGHLLCRIFRVVRNVAFLRRLARVTAGCAGPPLASLDSADPVPCSDWRSAKLGLQPKFFRKFVEKFMLPPLLGVLDPDWLCPDLELVLLRGLFLGLATYRW